MHKKIVNSISKTLEHLKEKGCLKIFIDDKETDAFWSMIIVFNPKFVHLINRVEIMSREIGWLNGEGVWLEKFSDSLEIS